MDSWEFGNKHIHAYTWRKHAKGHHFLGHHSQSVSLWRRVAPLSVHGVASKLVPLKNGVTNLIYKLIFLIIIILDNDNYFVFNGTKAKRGDSTRGVHMAIFWYIQLLLHNYSSWFYFNTLHILTFNLQSCTCYALFNLFVVLDNLFLFSFREAKSKGNF